ncbi:MAG: RelA/SpoT family protein [Patescibacteria group bacterium]
MASLKIQQLIKENEFIRKAYNLAEESHRGQKRKSGDPYLNHVLATAELVWEWGLDQTSVAAALLHDVVEDTGYSLEKIKSEFGDEVAFIVGGVTKLGKIKYRGVERQVENLRKMILALSQDIRVIIVKLADRLHNMRTLNALPPQKQKRIALETMEIYAPIAYRLGMQKISGDLEDISFPYIYPREYRWLIENTQEKYEEREKYLERVKPIVLEAMKKAGIEVVDIDSRAKRYASLYKKLLRPGMNMDIDKIYDLVALRIVVKNIEDCYAALGVIHNLWPPLPNKITDYIALPKPNGYRSLHTKVFCLDNKITEIQIRTKEMHEEAETGIAAHWIYEQVRNLGDYLEKKAPAADKKELYWVQQLRNWQKEFTNPDEFIESLKIDFFKDRIFAITPKGEVIDLPSGVTPVDFAYHIHTAVGNSCVGARVNDKIVPLDYALKSGDIVEIMTQKNKKPSESWLTFVKTNHARNHIRAALKTKPEGLSAKEPEGSELRITVEDKPDLISQITAVISRSHANILAVNTITNSRFPSFRIKCDAANKEKIEKLLVKLKKIKEIKEISYVFLH